MKTITLSENELQADLQSQDGLKIPPRKCGVKLITDELDEGFVDGQQFKAIKPEFETTLHFKLASGDGAKTFDMAADDVDMKVKTVKVNRWDRRSRQTAASCMVVAEVPEVTGGADRFDLAAGDDGEFLFLVLRCRCARPRHRHWHTS